ncbi:hypothetical protein BD779DRAFT_1647965 [Infundibulicybe gibba]|nr:hypothetical protein BD779DRAFT_1647965 [Infundibulicybe gibba]
MRPSNPLRTCSSACMVLICLVLRTSAYFMVSDPNSGTQWVNGNSYSVTWTKGVLDGIDVVDIEMARLGQDGLTFIARNVPSTSGSLNVQIQDVPAGDDYFLIFLDSTHGVMYATSQRFSILPASSTPTGTAKSPDGKVATVTVSGKPDPTVAFVTTFPAVVSGARGLLATTDQICGLLTVLVACLLGAAWTVW